MNRPIIDLSFINPQALSSESWILRLPLIKRLATHARPWNAFWVETFELITNERPASCERLLDAAFPSLPGTPNPRWISGYVWRDGFTIFRTTPWRNTFRAIGTGDFSSRDGLTHISFRVGANRYGAYALLLMWLLFTGAGGVLLGVGAVARVALPWAAMGPVLIAVPLALFVAGGRTVSRKTGRSEEAERLIAAVADIIDARELRSH